MKYVKEQKRLRKGTINMVNNSLRLLNSKLPIWVKKVSSNYGSILELQCGVLPFPDKKVTFSIFLYLCDWKIYQGTNILLTNNYRSYEKSRRIMVYLQDVGKKIVSIALCEPMQKFTIELEKQIMIEAYPNLKQYREKDDLVNFFIQGEQVLCYSPQEKFYFESNGNAWQGTQIEK